MKQLTPTQFSSIQDLAKSQLIEQWSIDGHSNGLLRVTVISKPDADWNSVDALLEEVFPGMEYRGTPGQSEHGEHYSIDVEGETLVNLLMKKSGNWTGEDIVRQEA